MSSLFRCFKGSKSLWAVGTRFDSLRHPKNAKSIPHQAARCLAWLRSREPWNLIRWSTEIGNFWWTGLESCALRPFMEAETWTFSNTCVEEGSKKLAKYFTLLRMFAADSEDKSSLYSGEL